ncbi:DUF2071 domain-containing protein [Hymenobacter monticola]|uniref:DUF2071 domain-containing protein n=1 Tax=Hymenobacter monticola TaxID=1705399 RepID=A0ABY4B298_9BACT|nr:DUF2071 domain-containing protein [Hymenobacter monticola]UOE32979.1 DUF2071 domain-containing protein [Hymenobacter monticola]
MISLPLTGVIDRRLLLNFRADVAAVNALLPAPFRAQVVEGHAIVGICLIRLKHERIKGLPPLLGLTSENGAHRFAVEWEAGGQRQTGVFIPRRDTSSRLNYFFGNQFLGIHHHSTFQVAEGGGKYAVAFQSPDHTYLEVEAKETTAWPDTSLFSSLDEASNFFRLGSAGYSPQATGCGFDGVALSTNDWQVAPVAVERISSSYFANEELFPAGSVEFDNALLMRGTKHEWQRLPSL